MISRRLTAADRVWNRACSREGTDLREGDVALRALLLVDGYIQNGGVAHAHDLTPEELTDGMKGFEFFGLHELVAAIKSYRPEKTKECNAKYYAFTRVPNQIREKFAKMYAEHPERFAPITEPKKR